MFTLKLYQNTPRPSGRIAVMECAGIWITTVDNGVKEIYVFKDRVGVDDADNHTEHFFVGGEPAAEQDAIHKGLGGNWYDWGVVENAQGKTTEMIR